MRQGFPLAVLLALCACSPAGSGDNPRDRKGADGKLTWRVVAQADGQAAFLSRPGAAPDLVLWCRDTGQMTLRAHVFENPAAQPDLIMNTTGATIVFQNVRRQGGVRAGDRELVEGSVITSDGKLPLALLGAGTLQVTSGSEDYSAKDTDPNGVLPAFTAACTNRPPPEKANKKS
jgi:hypothetical protein